jgi:hypothetical protein
MRLEATKIEKKRVSVTFPQAIVVGRGRDYKRRYFGKARQERSLRPLKLMV